MDKTYKIRERILQIIRNIAFVEDWDKQELIEDIASLIETERKDALMKLLDVNELPRLRLGFYDEKTGKSEDVIRVPVLEKYITTILVESDSNPFKAFNKWSQEVNKLQEQDK